MNPDTSGIYAIKNLINGKMYIGQSVNIRERLYGHKYDLKSGKHNNLHLQSAVNKYGLENFSFEALALCDECELDDLERFYIAKYHTMNRKFGYNVEEGGHYGRHRAPETIEKMRRANLGKKLSEETRKKMSENSKRHADQARESIRKNSYTWGKRGGECPFAKPVIQYDLDGNFIKEWDCIQDASQTLHIKDANISRVCKGKRKTCGGFKWAYKSKGVALFQT